jgi:membrane associated rhomboid family serine protease
MGKWLKYLIVGVLVACYVLSIGTDASCWGYSTTSEWWKRFTYMFFHGNLFHLAMNCFGLWAFVSVIEKETVFSQTFILLSSLVIGVLGTFGSEYPIPTIGISGAVFALLGMRVYYYRERMWVICVLGVMMAQIIYPFFSSVNTKVHCLCVVYGIALMFIISKIKKYLKRKNYEKSILFSKTLS